MADENTTTTIKVSRKLIDAIKAEGFMGEKYEDVIWRWRGKYRKKIGDEEPASYEASINNTSRKAKQRGRE